MFRNLASNLVLHERVVTTEAKAKEVRRVVERLITKARRLGKVAFEKAQEGSDSVSRLNVARYLEAELGRFGVRIEKGGESVRVDLVEKVLIELASRYSARPGGYTRIVRLGSRRGDGAPQAVIELVPGA